MQLIPIILVAALVFGLCHLVDKTISKIFRGKAQHHSGMAVRVGKHYGIFGVGLALLGILAICVGVTGGVALILGGIVVLAMGIALGLYYLTHGIFYDGETFLVTSLGKKDREYRYADIKEQKLYLIQGGSLVIELYMEDGSSVSLQSTMDGIGLFLDTAFAAWCLQKGIDPQSCGFHDPSRSWWFPHEEEV